MQASPDDVVECVKCDLLFCQEYGVVSPPAEPQAVNEEQRDSVKRALNFADIQSAFRDPNHDEDSNGTCSTVSNGNLSPSQIPLPYSSTESLNDIPKQKEWSCTPTMDNDLRCDEVMSPSPDAKSGHANSLLNEETKSDIESSDEWSDLELPNDQDEPNARQVVYLNNKRQHSQYAYDASGAVIIVKKKRLDF